MQCSVIYFSIDGPGFQKSVYFGIWNWRLPRQIGENEFWTYKTLIWEIWSITSIVLDRLPMTWGFESIPWKNTFLHFSSQVFGIFKPIFWQIVGTRKSDFMYTRFTNNWSVVFIKCPNYFLKSYNCVHKNFTKPKWRVQNKRA